MTRTRTATATVAAALLLLLAGCGDSESEDPGGSGGSGGEQGGEDGENTGQADPGPECVGEADPTGTRALFGGETELPGGGTLSYAAASSDGTDRQADLTQGGDTTTLSLDDQLTVQGNDWTVSQICTYRVILTPADQALAQDPDAVETDPEWPITQGGFWELHTGITDDRPDPPLSVAVTSIDEDPATASIQLNAEGANLASYDDTPVGATVEIADQLWEIADITAETDADPATVRLQPLGPALP
ncbi:hypothetical protein [Streptomyces sp. B6B3]|uniref:hypothetical protein n=1 Tax=Streptomyces sp. B6B3 TaxID=3153570 RepID=UPI00325CE21F